MAISPPKTILLVGRRGRGKSSLANLLRSGEHWNEDFSVSHGAASAISGATQLLDSQVMPNYRIQDTNGFDGTVIASKIIDEIQALISAQQSIDGILFVLNSGRADDWDKAVFEIYLQFILLGVPNSMIGVVFTRSNDDVISNNTWGYYNSTTTCVTDTDQKDFMQSLLTRCDGKICFVDNACPKGEIMNRDPLRKMSLDNLQKLISSLNGKFSFVGMLPRLYNQYTFWSTKIKENPLKMGAAALGIIIAVAGAFATAPVAVGAVGAGAAAGAGAGAAVGAGAAAGAGAGAAAGAAGIGASEVIMGIVGVAATLLRPKT